MTSDRLGAVRRILAILHEYHSLVLQAATDVKAEILFEPGGPAVDLVLLQHTVDVPVARAYAPEAPILFLVPSPSDGDTLRQALQMRPFDIIMLPITRELLALKLRRTFEVYDAAAETARLEAQLEPTTAPIVGRSKPIRMLVERIARVADAMAPVHIFGETGTGKELVAQTIHTFSRRVGALVKVNCGALPETLIESELFGYEKGAFTGAQKRKQGRFELADKGTIFLDEVGEIPLAMQVKLLRVLQEGEVDRIGGEAPIKVDVRVVSATNRDLAKEVEAGRFREDLFYRLNVLRLEVPPLRARREDVPLLVNHFLLKNPRVERFSVEALRALEVYSFPGNVRELENIVAQAAVFATPPEVKSQDLPPQVLVSAGAAMMMHSAQALEERGLARALEEYERALVVRALEHADGVRTEAARLLKVRPAELVRRLQRFGL